MTAALVLLFLLFAEDFDTALREGLIALQKGELASARDRLSAAAKQKPESGIAWVALAQAHARLGQTDEGDRAAKQAEAAGGQQPAVLRALILYWSGRGQHESVVQVARKAVQQEDRADLQNVLGKAYMATERYDEGLTHLRAAVQAQPANEQFVFDLGQALLRVEQFDAAAQVLEAGTKLLERSPQLQLALGVARYAQRRFPEAIAAFLNTIKLQSEIEQPYVFLGKILDHAGDRSAEIQKRAADFLQLNPENAAVNLVYAKVLAREPQVDPSKVEQYLRRSIAKDESSWEAHLELGVLLARMRKYEEAAVELEKATKLRPSEAVPHYHLARVYDRLGRSQEANAERTIHEKLTKSK